LVLRNWPIDILIVMLVGEVVICAVEIQIFVVLLILWAVCILFVFVLLLTASNAAYKHKQKRNPAQPHYQCDMNKIFDPSWFQRICPFNVWICNLIDKPPCSTPRAAISFFLLCFLLILS